MHLYIGSDHGGLAYKDMLVKKLGEEGYSITDCGAYKSEPTDDYPDFALAVGKAVSEHPEGRGILLCRSGEGMEMAVNKLPKIRAALVWKEQVARETRNDNDANVIVLPSDYLTEAEVLSITNTFLETPFSNGDRHRRRLEKLMAIERGRYES